MLQILNQDSGADGQGWRGELNDEQREGKKISCFECRHFFITHEPAHPYGCQAMGFKSPDLPSAVVVSSSGEARLVFESKDRGRGKRG
jgi:hypothetical protein